MFKAPGLFTWCCTTLFPVSPQDFRIPFVKRVLWSGALTFGYECTVYVEVDVGSGGAEVDVVYISFIMSVRHIGYLVPYKDKVQLDSWNTVYSTRYDNLDRGY